MQQASNENKREQSMRNNQRKGIIISFNYLDYFYLFFDFAVNKYQTFKVSQ